MIISHFDRDWFKQEKSKANKTGAELWSLLGKDFLLIKRNGKRLGTSVL
jgi:hypothetical protein